MNIEAKLATRLKLILFVICLVNLIGCDSTDQAAELKETIYNNPDFKNWSHYLGDPARTHYSILSEIDTNNVHLLKPVWQYESGPAATRQK